MAALKIAFLSSRPLKDRRNWSGTMFKMYESLRAHGFDMVWVPTPSFSAREEKVFSWIQKTYEGVFNRTFNRHHFILKSFLASRKLARKLNEVDYDLLFAPTYATEIAFLNSGKPVIYLNDATFNKLINYYPAFMGLGWLSKTITRFIENKALEKADHLVFSSEWAAEDAHKTYGIPQKKISVIKFGANLNVPEKALPERDFSAGINFLFSAVDWQRKGGEKAFETVKILQTRGHSVSLKIMGCSPAVEGDFVEIIPFLDKNNPAELTEIERHLSEAHFLFVPTLADCTPIAFCEAAAYSLPVLSTATGGVTAHVVHGKSGFLMPESATAQDYAELIETEILNKRSALPRLAANARRKYEEELNWRVWGEKMNQSIQTIIEKL